MFTIIGQHRTIKVFQISETPEGSLSFMTPEALDRDPLPDKFIICCSYKQNALLGRAPYTVQGRDGTPWFTISLWKSGPEAYLWIRVRSTWKRITKIERHWLNSFVHVCSELDITNGDVKIAVNGKDPISLNVEDLKKENPVSLENTLMVGHSELINGKPLSYEGFITNFKVIDSTASTSDVQELSQNLCDSTGTIINEGTKWKLNGKVAELEEESWIICNKNLTYRLAIPSAMNWYESMDVCRKLSFGNVTEVKDWKDLNYVVSLFSNPTAVCEFIWTPYSDENDEGTYINARFGNLASYMPWEVSEPNGGTDESLVLLSRITKGYSDNVSTKGPACTVCEIDVTAKFNLIGVCKETYFGEKQTDAFIIDDISLFK